MDIHKILEMAKKYIPQGPSPYETGAAASAALRYEQLSIHEKHTMATESPEMFQELREDWQRRGEPAGEHVPTTLEMAAKGDARVLFEMLSPDEKAKLLATAPERYAALKADWSRRGQPGPKAPPAIEAPARPVQAMNITAGALYGGRPYEALSFTEKDALKTSDPDRFAAMQADWHRRARRAG